MSSKTKKMLGLLAVLLLLVGAYVAVTQRSDAESPAPDGDQSSGQQAQTVLAVDPNMLAAFSYTLDGVEYRYDLSEDYTHWIWEGDVTLPLSNNEITAMISTVTDVTSEHKYQNIAAESLADYGLSDGCFRMTFTFLDGSSLAVRIGKTNVFNGLAYFCREDDPETVYMVKSYLPSFFAKTPADIVEQDALPTFTAPQLRAFRVELGGQSVLANYDDAESEQSGESGEKVLSLYVNDADAVQVDAEAAQAATDALVGLRFERAVTFDPALWESYGVGEQPVGILSVFYTYTNTVENDDGPMTSTELQTMYQLYFGNTDENGKTWVRLSDQSGVYALDLSAILSLADGE